MEDKDVIAAVGFNFMELADRAVNIDNLVTFLPGDRWNEESPDDTGTRFGPLLPLPSRGDNCGIKLDLLRVFSLRMGPIFDLRRPDLVELTARDVGGIRLLGLPLGICNKLSESSGNVLFMLRGDKGETFRPSRDLESFSPSSSARLASLNAPLTLRIGSRPDRGCL